MILPVQIQIIYFNIKVKVEWKVIENSLIYIDDLFYVKKNHVRQGYGMQC